MSDEPTRVQRVLAVTPPQVQAAAAAVPTLGRLMVAQLVILVALALIIYSLVAAWGREEVDATCGPTVTTPAVVSGMDASAKAGDLLRKAGHGGGLSDLQVFLLVRSAGDLLHNVWPQVFRAHLQGKPEPTVATGIRIQTAKNQAAALAACCPSPPSDPVDPPQTDPPKRTYPPGHDPRASFPAVVYGAPPTPEGQEAIIAVAVAQAKAMGVDDKGVLAITETGLVESEVRNLSYGDATSVGWLQQQSGWGTVSQRMQPAYAARKFFQAYLRVPGKDRMTAGQIAAEVQNPRADLRGKYQQREQDARKLLARVSPGDVPPAATDPTTPDSVQWCNSSTAEQNQPTGKADGSLATITARAKVLHLHNPYSPTQAVARMRAVKGDTSQSCLHVVAAAYGYPTTLSRDGTYGADEQWDLIPAKYRHAPNVPAPAGAILYWGPSPTNSDGHTAMSLGNNNVLSTGVGKDGTVGEKPLTYFNNGYGDYYGWTDPYYPDRTTIGEAA